MSRKLWNSSMVMVLFALFVNVVNYCFQILAGRFLTVENYGLVNTLFSLFLIFGAPYYAVRMIVSKETAVFETTGNSEGHAAFLTQVFGALTLLSLLVWGGVTFMYCLFPSLFAVDSYALLLLPLLMAITTYYMFVPVGIAQGLQMFFIMSFINFLLAVVKVASLFISAYLLPGGISPVLGILSITIAGTVLSAFAGFFMIKRKKPRLYVMKPRDAKPYKNKLLVKDSLHSIVANCVLVFLMNVDVIFVRRLSGEYDTGLYTASTMWGKVLVYALMATINLFYPKIVQRRISGQNTAKPYFKMLLLCLGAIVLLYAAVCFLARPVVLLVFGRQYIGSLAYISRSYPIAAMVALNYLNMNYLLATERGGPLVRVFVAAAALCAVLTALRALDMALARLWTASWS